MKLLQTTFLVAALTVLAGCNWDGGPVITSDSDHSVSLGGALEDSAPISQQVVRKLKGNGQTAVANILVSSPSADTIRLSGRVENDAVRQEAERLAYQVAGVRFVVNTLNILSQ